MSDVVETTYLDALRQAVERCIGVGKCVSRQPGAAMCRAFFRRCVGPNGAQ